MPNIFIDIQKERLSQNRKDLQDAGRLFREQVHGRNAGFRESGNLEPSFDRAQESKEMLRERWQWQKRWQDRERWQVKPVGLPDGKISMWTLVKTMCGVISRRDVVSVLLACLGISIMGLFLPYVSMQFYDEMIPSGESLDSLDEIRELRNQYIIPLATLLVSATIGATIFEATKALVLLRIRDKMSAVLQSALMERMYRMPTRFFQTYTAGRLGNMLMNICDVMHSLMYKMLSGSMAIVFTFVYFFQIHIYAPQLLGLSILACLLQIILMGLYLYFARDEQRRIRTATAEMSSLLYSLFKGMITIKSSGAEERIFNRWAHVFVDSLTQRADRNILLVMFPAFTALIATGTTTMTYYYSIQYGIGLANYAAYLSSYGLVTTALACFAKMLPELIVLKPAIEQCRPLLDTVPETSLSHVNREGEMLLSGKIEINDLSFRYDGSSPYIFKHLNLVINPGEYVAIVGGSGCGKSTLLRLLLGFEKPESGSIFYDQHNICRVDIQSLRKHIGTCLQDGRIFQGEVYENISITNPTAKQEEVWEAARLACLDRDIKELPMGMHTVLGEGGAGLSGGQCQRLLIARALVAHPSILILDEATSALDNITQKVVSDNLEHLHCTRITIAHRLSTIKHCDRIIVLDGGSVAEQGTFEELMAMRGRFYELAQRQIMDN